ncbi:MAG: TlyA family RNA methyltransferase [Halanaerobiales bacterium]|nr:TlyA family RNA methyltransferase [Halanaerobiales bacterium]
MASKERIDIFLKQKGYFSSRNKAQRSIMAGEVYVDDEIVDKPGSKIDVNSKIEIKGNSLPYVSRGGLKLEKALEVFSVNTVNMIAIDIGASTGGFTDCLLQNGAKRVYAVDVGYGQLAWKLRNDKKVTVIEKTNFRYMETEQIQELADLIVIDVSFISLRLIIPKALQFLKENGQIIALIKPQFEAGKAKVKKKGIVKDKNVHREVLTKLSQFFDQQELRLQDLDFSPIKGASSQNIEYLIHLQKEEYNNDLFFWGKRIADVVDKAHQDL